MRMTPSELERVRAPKSSTLAASFTKYSEAREYLRGERPLLSPPGYERPLTGLLQDATGRQSIMNPPLSTHDHTRGSHTVPCRVKGSGE